MERVPANPDTVGRISRAAVALFSRQGYHGTSTREIARLADLSEATLFRHFEHKEDIFISALQYSLSPITPRLEFITGCNAHRAPETVLPQIMGFLADIARYSPELVRLMAVAFLELHGEAEDVCCGHLTPLFTAIAGYLAVNMENGKLRSLNPSIVTGAMALTAIAQPEFSRLITGAGLATQGTREAIDEYSSFWLKVLLPPKHETGEISGQAIEIPHFS